MRDGAGGMFGVRRDGMGLGWGRKNILGQEGWGWDGAGRTFGAKEGWDGARMRQEEHSGTEGLGQERWDGGGMFGVRKDGMELRWGRRNIWGQKGHG